MCVYYYIIIYFTTPRRRNSIALCHYQSLSPARHYIIMYIYIYIHTYIHKIYLYNHDILYVCIGMGVMCLYIPYTYTLSRTVQCITVFRTNVVYLLSVHKQYPILAHLSFPYNIIYTHRVFF